MKIAFYLYSLSSGGAERVTATLANYWAAKDWAVTIITVADQEQDFYALDPRVKRIVLNLAVPSHNPVQALMYNLRRLWVLWRILRRDKPDVAVAMMATANAMLAVAGKLARVPTLGSERTYPPAMPLGRGWEAIRQRAYPLLSGLVAQTEESAVWLRQHAPARQIAVIPNPVHYPMAPHAPRVLPSEFSEFLRGRHLLLAVGRLGEEKRFDRLLTAFAALVERHPDWVLVILGQGGLHRALLEQAHVLDIADRVALPGVVGNVGDWFAAADLYALTSRFEGFPNTLVEALAYGVPSVAVDCETGPREILRHDVDGLLVPQDAPDALAAALDRLMSDANLRTRFAARAVEVRERFGVEKVARQWEVLMASLREGQ